MIPVPQRYTFDCMTACLASIFECAYEDAPVLCHPTTGDSLDQWHATLDIWLATRGWAHMERLRVLEDGDDLQRCPWRFPGYWIGGVKSPRYDGDHAIVMHGSAVVFDPHPGREAGHLGFVSAEYFVPLDVARFTFLAVAT